MDGLVSGPSPLAPDEERESREDAAGAASSHGDHQRTAPAWLQPEQTEKKRVQGKEHRGTCACNLKYAPNRSGLGDG